ncbi:MAG: DUF3047 domain-containing protein [Candidatus Aminicenantes bacterium]|nr:DUF3047 domain-containing protein [Candidatus Aminicenantes bacterium]
MIFLVILGGIIAGRVWCSTNHAEWQDKTKDGEGQEFLHIVSFPQEAIPIKKWLKENGWEVQRGSVETFVVREKTLFMQNMDASTAIGVKFDKKIDPRKYPEIEFRARVDEIPPASNVTVRNIDDAAFRLFVLFDKGGWILSPPQTIGYVWDTTKRVGSTGRSATFGKVRYIVIGSGSDGLGEWRAYRRNILEDYKLLFDSSEVPKIKALGLKCDSNHSNGHAASAIQWIRLRATKETWKKKD